MIYKRFKLADGQTVTFEELKEKDLPGVVEALNSVIREDVYLLFNEEITDMEGERRWYYDRMKAGMTYLVARVNGKVVGGASIVPKRAKQSHIVAYGIFIVNKYRGLGIGTKLTKALIKIAKKRGFEIMELSVYASNPRAKHVYEKCAFSEIGMIKNGVKMKDGTYTDEILMTLSLKR